MVLLRTAPPPFFWFFLVRAYVSSHLKGSVNTIFSRADGRAPWVGVRYNARPRRARPSIIRSNTIFSLLFRSLKYSHRAPAAMADRPLHVLYLHGLETDLRLPDTGKNTKLSVLRTAFSCSVPDLQTGRAAFDRRNSVLRSLLRLPQLRLGAVLGSFALAVTASTQAWPVLAAAAAVAVAAAAVAAALFLPAAVEASVVDTLAIAEAELARRPPDVLVGSSWGGALAALCVHRGSWDGPILLLAPAGQRISRRCVPGSVLAAQLCAPLPAPTRALVIQGSRDGTVPLADSQALCKNLPPTALRIRKGDCHALRSLMRAGSLAGLVREAAALG